MRRDLSALPGQRLGWRGSQACHSSGGRRVLWRTAAMATAWLLALSAWDAEAAPPQDPPSAAPASRHDDPYFEQTRPLTSVSRHGREFLAAFNAASQRPRIVAVLSPGDPLAQQEAARLNRLLQSEPDSNTAVLAVWVAHQSGDSLASALRATGLLSDSRVTHFHDLNRFVRNSLTARLEESAKSSPVLLLHYPPGTLWLDLPPRPGQVHVPGSEGSSQGIE